MSELSVLEHSREAIEKGSKTFSLAAKFFTKEQFEGAIHVYAWCRHCDDVIDDQQASIKELEMLKHKTFNSSVEPAFSGFESIRKTYHIPDLYPSEMLEGMRMDISQIEYRTLNDLKVYCYRVAGTVGLMMTHIMGLFNEKALENAAQLGMAMQLTNICRDVKEDYERGRVYLPQDLLALQEINENELMKPSNKGKLFETMKHLLLHAEEMYKVGEDGIRYLPLKSALAVTTAMNLYREIGREILKRGPEAIDTRVVISPKRKMILTLKSLLQISRSIPERLLSRNKPIQIKSTWSLS